MIRSAVSAFNSFKEQGLPIGPFLHGAEEPRPGGTQNYLGMGLCRQGRQKFGKFQLRRLKELK